MLASISSTRAHGKFGYFEYFFRGGRGRPRARARVSGRGSHREEEQVTSSSPPLGMSEEIPRRLRPRKVVNYKYMLEIDSD